MSRAFRVGALAALSCTPLLFVHGLQGCAIDPGVETRAGRIVYDSDDRRDYFDVPEEPVRNLLAASAIALVPKVFLDPKGGGLSEAVPSFGEQDRLCPGERFADQPAAAFCSGVLVDWDLVLTAGHCTRLLALGEFVAVMGYYAPAPGQLAVAAGDIFAVTDIVAARNDPGGVEPRLDYAWLRLDRRASPPREPIPVRVRPPPLAVGDAITSISAVGGTPMKAAGQAQVRDARAQPADYFVADTDTSHGSSGGGAFDEALSLVGVLARGGTDLTGTPDGCYTTFVSDGAAAEEHFTYAHQAVAGLCAEPAASSLCRADCADPCSALPRPPDEDGGCALAGRAGPADGLAPALLLVAGLRKARSRRRKSASSGRR